MWAFSGVLGLSAHTNRQIEQDLMKLIPKECYRYLSAYSMGVSTARGAMSINSAC